MMAIVDMRGVFLYAFRMRAVLRRGETASLKIMVGDFEIRQQFKRVT